MNSTDNSAYVYIMSSPDRTALYTGVTSELPIRVAKHRTKFYPSSFSARYNCVMLVCYANCGSNLSAIAEEKRIKGGSRKQKEELILSMNPGWVDLYDSIRL